MHPVQRTSILQSILGTHPKLSGWNHHHPLWLRDAALNQLLEFSFLCDPELVIHSRDRVRIPHTRRMIP